VIPSLGLGDKSALQRLVCRWQGHLIILSKTSPKLKEIFLQACAGEERTSVDFERRLSSGLMVGSLGNEIIMASVA